MFVRKDASDEAVTAFLREHSFDPVELAFRTAPAITESPLRDFSKPATTYDNLFSLRRPTVPGEIQFGQHFLRLAAADGVNSIAKRMAATLLAIRHANEGLRIRSEFRRGISNSWIGLLPSGSIRNRDIDAIRFTDSKRIAILSGSFRSSAGDRTFARRHFTDSTIVSAVRIDGPSTFNSNLFEN